MSESEKEMSVISSDIPIHLGLSVEVKEELSKIKNSVGDLICLLEDGKHEQDDEHGMSLLQLKNLLMMDYLTNLSLVMFKKASGVSIEGDETIERLVEDRTFLEKLKPMESKLKYQISKAIKIAEAGTVQADDPMNFKANPSSLITKLDDDDSDSDGDSEDKNSNENTDGVKKYVPPKQVPAFFDDKSQRESDFQDQEVRKKKQMISKAIVQDLKSQYLETPEEIYEKEDVVKRKHLDAMKERTRYEEENFIRLPVSKKDKHARRQLSTIGTLGNEITSFGFSDSSGSKKRKRKSGKGMKKSFGKKRFRK